MSMQAAVYTKSHNHHAAFSPASTRASPTSFELDQLLTTLTSDQIAYLRTLLSSDFHLSDLRCHLNDCSQKLKSPSRSNAQNKQMAARLHDLLEKENYACDSCNNQGVLMSQLEAEVCRLNEKLSSESARFCAEKEEWREALENGEDSSLMKSEIKELRRSLAESKRLIQSLKATHMAELAAIERDTASLDKETETESAVSLKRENHRLSKAVEEGNKLVADLRLTILRLASKPGDDAEECELSAAYAKVVAEKIESEKVSSAVQQSLESLRHEHRELSVSVESLKRQLEFSKTDKVQMSDQMEMLEKERAQLRQSLLEVQAKTHSLQSEADAVKTQLQTEVETLHQSLLANRQLVATLQAQVNEISHAKAAAESEAKRASEELTRLRCGSDGELLRLRESAEEAESNLRKLEANVASLATELEASERRAAGLSLEVERLRTSAAGFEADAAHLKRKLVHSVEESRQELRAAKVELSKLRGAKEDSDRIIANLHADIRRLNANKEETERTLTSLQAEMTPLKAARDGALRKVVDLEVEVTRLLETTSLLHTSTHSSEAQDGDQHVVQYSAHHTQSTLEKAEVDLAKEIEELKLQLDRKGEEIELLTIDKQLALQELTEQHHSAIDQLQQKYQQIHQQYQELQDQLRTAQEDARKILKQSCESDSIQETPSAELEEALEHNAKLSEKVKSLEESLLNVSMLEEHIASLEQDIKDGGERERRLGEDARQAQDRIEELRANIEHLEEKQEQQRLEAEGRVNNLVSQIKSAEKQIESLIEERCEMESRLNDLQSELDQLTRINHSLQDQVARIRGEKREAEEKLRAELVAAEKSAADAEAALNASLEEGDVSSGQAALNLNGASPTEQLRSLKIALRQKTSMLNDERARAAMVSERMKEKEDLIKNCKQQMLAVEEAWKIEFETYEAHLHKTCSQLTEANNDKQRLMSEMAKQSKELTAMRNLMEKNNEELEAVQSFKKEHKTLTKTIQVLEAKCDQLRKRIIELESAPPKREEKVAKTPSSALRSPDTMMVASAVGVLFAIVGYLSGSSTI